MRWIGAVAFAALMASTVGASAAVNLTYSVNSTVSGTLDGVAFPDSATTLTFTSTGTPVASPYFPDTFHPGQFYTLDGHTTFDIAGVGTGSFTGIQTILDNQSGSYAGIVEQGDTGTLVVMLDSFFQTYALTAPVSLSTVGEFGFASPTFGTDQGNLFFSPANFREGFQFTALESISDVPEPSTWAMFMMGFGGIGLLLRRQRKIAAA